MAPKRAIDYISAFELNPEEELYFIQQFAEYIGNPRRNIVLITTLHQNFNSYAYKLNNSQQNEWEKVKGRFKEIVFNEPVEQLLFLASNFLKENNSSAHIKNQENQKQFISDGFIFCICIDFSYTTVWTEREISFFFLGVRGAKQPQKL